MGAEMRVRNPFFMVTVMSGAPLRSHLRNAGRFARADEGNVAVIFAIALLPILGFVGAAVD